MRFIKSSFVAALCVVGSSIGAQAQTGPDSLNLLGRTSLTFGLGLTGARTSDVTFSQVQTHTTGQLASLAFTHWVRPGVAVQISTGVLNADNRVSGTHVQDNAIIPILFGVSASPRELALSASVRPYVSLAAGPYIHAVDDVNVGSVNSLMETTAGAKAAVGANWFVSRHFIVNVEGDYHVVGKFEHPDALTSKPSGFGMAIGLGLAWGGR
jgi:hypothetical protein